MQGHDSTAKILAPSLPCPGTPPASSVPKRRWHPPAVILPSLPLFYTAKVVENPTEIHNTASELFGVQIS
jgi:hypothetical protein